MNTILRVFVVAVACYLNVAAHAATTCQATPNGALCTSQVDFGRFAQTAFQTQDQSQWCWAASISMIFGYYGYNVSQARIVAEAYGGVVNLPAVAGVVMAQSLNRSWIDDSRHTFTSHLSGAYDPAAGFSNIDNSRLVRELDQNRPFIFGTAGHAVVVTAIQYYQTPSGPSIVAMGVFDPWPGRGARGLSAAEMTPSALGGGLTFIATADVQADSGGAGQNPFSTGGGGGASDPVLIVILLAFAVGVLIQQRRRR